MELEVTSAFPTRIGGLRVPDADAMNQYFRAEPAVAGLTTWVTCVGNR